MSIRSTLILKLLFSCFVCMYIVFFILLVRPVTAQVNGELVVYFIDVDQGDSILIITPENQTILIDGGRPESAKQLLDFLNEKGIRKINTVIATHPDIDHIGGLVTVLQNFQVDEVIRTNQAYHTKTFKRFISLIHQQSFKETKINHESMRRFGEDVVIQFMNTFSTENDPTNNEASLVIKLNYQQIDFLLMADVGIKEEKQLMKQYDLTANILKVGHHGSNTSSGKGFLEAVNPDVSILTYGRNNSFGHPVDRVIRNLHGIQTHIYATATHGTIEVRTAGDSIEMILEKSPLDILSQTLK